MMSLRTVRLIPCLLALLAACLMAGQAAAVAAPQPVPNDAESKEVDASVKRAVDYLLAHQLPDGSILNEKRNATTMTAFAIMGLLAVGHKPGDQTREGEALKRALAFVLRPDRQDKDGYFGRGDGSRMYGHGIICLMLGEILGMGVDEAQDKLVRERLKKGIELILRAQAVPKKSPKDNGGWRYTPDAPDADLSVSSWQLMALRAAKDAGLDVPKTAIDKALAYVKNCYYSNTQKKDGKVVNLFSYTAGAQHGTFGAAAGGLLVLQICGDFDAPEVKAAADYFLTYAIPPLQSNEHVYYGLYYYSQAMNQRGDKYADHARQVVHDYLVKTQLPDGSWPLGNKDKEGGTIYVTSLALLSLSIHYHFLPIYQR